MQRWVAHWFGPVAAIRPYVFQKFFTLMLACDLLVLMVERGARYGTDAVSFNVPHFAWLDSFHRLFLPDGVPTATYYVGGLSITSFLFFCLFFAGHRSWLMAIATCLYTYSWSMSRLDSYLHHYMLSLIMFCMVFFPRVDADDLKNWLLDKSDKQKRKPKSDPANLLSFLAIAMLSLAFAYCFALSDTVGLTDSQRWFAMIGFFTVLCGIVYRGNTWVRPGHGPHVSAWSYRMLVTTVGVIYVFAAVAKMDAEWCGGHTLKAVGTTEQVLQPIAELSTMFGISVDTFWTALATFIVPLELGLASLYIISVWQDEPNRIWFRRACFFGWLLAVGLHLNNEMMHLIIQWFGYYMLLLATILLLPARILLIAGQFFIWPEVWIRERFRKFLDSSPSTLMVAGSLVLSILSILTFGFITQILGSLLASAILATSLIVVLIAGLFLSWGKRSWLVTLTSIAASVSMICAVAQSSMQFDYYDLRGKSLMSVGRHEEAVREMEMATAFRAPTSRASAELLSNLAVCYRQAGIDSNDVETLKEALKNSERAFRDAIAADPYQILAHYGLANLLTSVSRFDEAEKHYRQAIEIKSDFSDAYVNLGNMLEHQGKLAVAIECYERAAEIEPHAPDIQQMLKVAREKSNESDNY